MTRTNSRESTATGQLCAVPSCREPARTRGLCTRHYGHAKNPKASEHDLAKECLQPSRRGQHSKQPAAKAPAGKPAEIPRLPRPPRTGSADSERKDAGEDEPGNDEVVATVTEFATALGIERMPYDGGFIFRSGDNLVHLSTQGEVRRAQITLGDFIHHSAGR